MDALPWAAISVLLLGVLGLWGYCSATRKELEDFKVKVAENYTTTPALDKAIATLAMAMNELKTELRDFRREIHNERRGFQAGN